MYKYLLLLLLLIPATYADTNGVWYYPRDIIGGIFGSDEQPISNYTFIDEVYYNTTIYTGKIYDIFDNSYYINLSGESRISVIDTNTMYVSTVNIGSGVRQTSLDVDGAIKIGYSNLCNINTEGSMRYNSTAKIIEVCDGSFWNEIDVVE